MPRGPCRARAALGEFQYRDKLFFVTPRGRARLKQLAASFVPGISFFWLRLMGRAGLGLLWANFITGKSFFFVVVTPSGPCRARVFCYTLWARQAQAALGEFRSRGKLFWVRPRGPCGAQAALGELHYKEKFFFVTHCGRAGHKLPGASFVPGESIDWSRLVGRAGLGLLWASLINGKSFFLFNCYTSWACQAQAALGEFRSRGKLSLVTPRGPCRARAASGVFH